MSNGISRFSFSVNAQFGAGSVAGVGQEASRAGIKKALIVCDPTMVKLGLAQKVGEALTTAGVESVVFDRCSENPKAEDVDAGAAVYKQEGCDGLIGLGGGSPIDEAKGIRVVARHGGAAVDYNVKTGGARKIGPDLPPLLAIPTTSGTGSEVTKAAVITDTARQVKFVVFAPNLLPSVAILDPELTVTMPPLVTAATGFDALVHAIEAYVNARYDPLADGFCRQNFELIGQSYKKAVTNGADIEARTDIMLASFVAGIAFSMKGLGAVHALAHPLSAAFGIPHGTANSLMLPQVMKFNSGLVGDKYVDAVNRLGFKVGTPDEAAAAMTDLARAVGLPTRLSEAGVTADKLPVIAKDAINDVSTGGNPVKCEEKDMLEMYTKAM